MKQNERSSRAQVVSRIAAWVLCLCAVSANGQPAEAPALLPLPMDVRFEPGHLVFSGAFAPTWSGCRGPALDRALLRLNDDAFRLTGVARSTQPAAALSIRCDAPFDLEDGHRDEGYRLTVAQDGVSVHADGAAGVLRAFATLRQLLGLRGGQPTIAFARVVDAPRFAWRGVMLDTARNFISPATLERQLDAMERVKLNVLHLHLSDNEGFRVESKRYPKLNAVSSHGQYYSHAEIRRLVAYAADRGVLVVPELDVPGHTRAIVDAYPEIGAFGPQLPNSPFPPDVALNPAAPRTYEFLRGLIDEMAALFPGPYFHIGGDEVSDAVWADNADVKALMAREGLKSKHDFEGYFARRVVRLVRDAGKTAIGWEEVATAGAPTAVVIQAWQTSNATAHATAAGHRTIVSAGYYLDLLMPADFHYAIDPFDVAAAGFTPDEAESARKLNPLLARALTDALIARPLPALTPAQEKLIMGAETPLWSELVSDEMVDHRLWPRAAALAERFWSPASVRDSSDMYRRLIAIDHQLTIQGLAGDAQRRRMTLRIAGNDAEPVERLLEIVTPVRNMAHDHRIRAALRGQRVVQPLNALADAAPADSLVARGFIADARRFVSGDATSIARLREQLMRWRDNEARFAAVARGNPLLEPAVPTSARIASLARSALAALDAIEARRALDEVATEQAQSLLTELEKAEDASRLPLLSFLHPQPPADLIIAITPGIRVLIEHARRAASPPAANDAPAALVGMVSEPCTRLPPKPDAVRELEQAFVEPGKPNLTRLLALTQRPEFVAYDQAKKKAEAQDWAGLCRYREANAAVLASGERPDVVFMGDSITENWVIADPSLFSAHKLGRGIGGQTTAQMLVRFHADVVALRPRVVHLLAGTNDIAGNGGPTSEHAFRDNIMAIVEIARAHGIRVVLGSIPPADRFRWRPEIKPAAQIARLNAWLRSYAAGERIPFIDYHSRLATADGAMKPELSIDGVHPNREGYAVMRSLVESVR